MTDTEMDAPSKKLPIANRHRMGIFISPEEHELLLQARAITGESMNSLVRRAIRAMAQQLNIKLSY